MITQSAAELEALASEVIMLRKSQQHGQSLANRAQLVEALQARLIGALTACDLLARKLNEEHPPSPVLEQALRKLIDWRHSLDDDLGAALGGDLFQTLQNSLGRALQEIEGRATQLWQRYFAQAVPDSSNEILEALGSDSQARATVITIRRLSQVVARLRDSSVPTAEEIDEFDVSIAALRSAWASLDVESLNDEIVSFLRSANSDRGAAINLLTQTVLDWLDERGAADHYVIRPTEQ